MKFILFLVVLKRLGFMLYKRINFINNFSYISLNILVSKLFINYILFYKLFKKWNYDVLFYKIDLFFKYFFEIIFNLLGKGRKEEMKKYILKCFDIKWFIY